MAQLLYFSWMREQVGQAQEHLTIPEGVDTVSSLITVLKTRSDGHAKAFANISRIRIAVNQEHVQADHPVSDSDEIAFFPPVTGG